MRTEVIEGRGRIIVNALRTGEISFLVDNGQGTSGAILTPLQAAELNCVIIAAIREAKKS